MQVMYTGLEVEKNLDFMNECDLVDVYRTLRSDEALQWYTEK